MEAPRVDEHRRLPVEGALDGPPAEREVGVAREEHRRREVHLAREPGPDLMDGAALDVERPRPPA